MHGRCEQGLEVRRTVLGDAFPSKDPNRRNRLKLFLREKGSAC